MAQALCMLDNHGCVHTHTYTHKHTEYVLLIALPRQQWLRKWGINITFTSTLSVLLLFDKTGDVLVTSWRFSVTIVAVETRQCILCVLFLIYMPLLGILNTESRTTVIL